MRRVLPRSPFATLAAAALAGVLALLPVAAHASAPVRPAGMSITASPGTVVYGQSETLTVQVTGVAGDPTPTGVITFSDTTSGAFCSEFIQPMPLDNSGTATCAKNTLFPGAQTITATYSGDSTYTSLSASVLVTVNKANVTVALSQTPDPVVTGQPVTYNASIAPASPSTGVPTGTATFDDNGAAVAGCAGIRVPSSGTVSCAATSGASGSHTISVSYTGDSNFNAGNASTGTSVISPPTVSMTLSDATNPATYGLNTTIDAALSWPSGDPVPTGTVSFSDTSGPITCNGGSTTVAVNGSGVASCSAGGLVLGDNTINAHYSGDTTYPIQNASMTETTQKASARPNFTASGSTVASGATFSVVLHLTQTAGLPVPSGTAAFTLGGAAVSGCQNVNADSSGNVTCTATAPTAYGDYNILASYNGDSYYAAEGSSSVYTLTVVSATRQAGFISEYNFSPTQLVTGQTFTITGQMQYLDTSDPWTGTVSFQANSQPISSCQNIPVTTGTLTAACTASLQAGTYDITASYSGDAYRTPSTTSIASPVVAKANTTTSVNAAPTNPGPGQNVTFTVSVQGYEADGTTPVTWEHPTGPVVVSYNGAAPGSCTVQLSSGTGSCSIAAPASAGSYVVIAEYYPGDSQFNPNYDGSGSINVAQAAVISETSSVNPSTLAQPVTFTASVSGSSGTPTGSITFTDQNNNVLGGCSAVPVASDGTAQCTYTFTSAGSFPVVAQYSGDSTYGPSQASLTQTVGKATPAMTETSSANPGTTNVPVDLTATVSGVSGGPVPTGTVTFYDPSGTAISGCTGVSLDSNGHAMCAPTFFTAGTYAESATYSGDGNYNGAASSLSEVINPATSTSPTGGVTGGTTSTGGSASGGPVSGGGGGTITPPSSNPAPAPPVLTLPPAPAPTPTPTPTPAPTPAPGPVTGPSPQPTASPTPVPSFVPRPSAPSPPAHNNGSNGGWVLPLIAAAAAGWPFVAVLLIVVFFLFWRRRRRRKNKKGDGTPPDGGDELFPRL